MLGQGYQSICYFICLIGQYCHIERDLVDIYATKINSDCQLAAFEKYSPAILGLPEEEPKKEEPQTETQSN